MEFFKEVKTLAELRRQYIRLLRKYHPDNGGDTETCQKLNQAYENLRQILEATEARETRSAHRTDSKADADFKRKWDKKLDKAIREIIAQLAGIPDINIEIVGSWIWVDGATFACKDRLKELGFEWSRSRKKWHWSSGPRKRYKGKKADFNTIRKTYGSEVVETENVAAIG